MNRIKRYLLVAFRFLKKIIKGENILIIEQEQNKWDNQHQQGKWNKLDEDGSYQPHFYTIVNLVKKYQPDKMINILDVGCGQGFLYQAMKSNLDNFSYSGLDLSSVALERFKKDFPELELVQADANKPPFLANKFDIIIFNESLYYLDFYKAISKYKKLLKDNGLVIVSMYVTWRTRLIWLIIKRFFIIIDKYKVKNNNNSVIWIVKALQFK